MEDRLVSGRVIGDSLMNILISASTVSLRSTLQHEYGVFSAISDLVLQEIVIMQRLCSLCTAICIMTQHMHSENSACRQPIRGRRLGICHSGALDTLDPLLLRGFLFLFLFFIYLDFFFLFSFFFWSTRSTHLSIEERMENWKILL